MKLYIKKVTTTSEDSILLNPSFREFFTNEENKVHLHFGNWNKEVNLGFSEELDQNIMGISHSLMDPFTVPENIDFEWYNEGVHFYIGPVLGILRGTSFHHITRQRRNILLRYIRDYQNIKGLVVIFPLSEVCEGVKSIRGYYYNPNNPKQSWIEGIFPFPSAVFSRPVAGSGKKYQMIANFTGNRMFNTMDVGKWVFYNTLSKHSEAKTLVPHTEVYINFQQIARMLNQHGILYIKRRNGFKGYGIIQINKKEDGIEVTRVNKNDQKKEFLHSDLELEAYLQGFISRNRYIIQQGIPFKAENKNVDFRAYLQKDSSKEWQLRGFIGRQGKEDSVITNIRYSEKVLSSNEALREFYGFEEEEAKEFIEKIESSCMMVVKCLDKDLGHFGDVALDFILDSAGNIFFLEVNAEYGVASFKKIKDYQLQSVVFKSPLEYAKALAGFPFKESESPTIND